MIATTNQAQGTTYKTPATTTDDGSVVFDFSDRTYRIRGLERNTSPMQLKVNILASRNELVHLDVLDLAKARSRGSFIKATAAELYVDEPVIKKDVGTLLLQLEQLRAARIEAALTAQNAKVELTAREKRAAMQFLRSPDLAQTILDDYDTCGLIGESTNKLVCYLACVSRRLDQPLAVLIQSGSAAGKTSLMDATLAFVPDEDQVRYSAMTGQSLYYMGHTNLKHKILAVAEEEGVALHRSAELTRLRSAKMPHYLEKENGLMFSLLFPSSHVEEVGLRNWGG
jgi:hypothetical protein